MLIQLKKKVLSATTRRAMVVDYIQPHQPVSFQTRMAKYESGIIPHSVHTLDVVEDAVGEAGLVLALGPGDGEKRRPSSSSRGGQSPVPGAKRGRRRG
jgi:hypothetical protein